METQLLPLPKPLQKIILIALLCFAAVVRGDYETGMLAAKRGDYLTASIDFIRAAQQGDSKARTALCVMYLGMAPGLLRDYAKAEYWCKNAAEEGLPDAQFLLGVQHDNGYGVPENDTLAIEWYSKAADQGYAPAQNSLRVQYRNGEGVPRDKEKMIEWYQKAAEQGYSPAMSNLGASYFMGDGVPADPILGYAWISLAAARGYPDAEYNDRIAKERMSSASLAKGVKAAKELEQKIYNNNKPERDLIKLIVGFSMDCIPLSKPNKTHKYKMFKLPHPGNSGWCYQGKQIADQNDPESYSVVEYEYELNNTIVHVNLTNIEGRSFTDSDQLLKFSNKTDLGEQTNWPCEESGSSLKCKFKYYTEEALDQTCVGYTRTAKGIRARYIGRGRLCIHPIAPNVLLSAEYGVATDKKLRGTKKKKFFAQAENFVNSIEFTAE